LLKTKLNRKVFKDIISIKGTARNEGFGCAKNTGCAEKKYAFVEAQS